MIKTSNLGYPRIGINRELKFALEKFWQSRITLEQLEQTAWEIQVHNWNLQREIGIDFKGKIIHKWPSSDSRFGKYGIFDLAQIDSSNIETFSEEAFEKAWQIDSGDIAS
jgi:hypothetical protein